MSVGEDADSNVRVTTVDKVDGGALLWLYVVDSHEIDSEEIAKMIKKVPESIMTGRPNDLVKVLQDQNININVYPTV